MRNIRNVHPSVRIDSDRLKQDRRVAGFTQASLSAACESVSLATIRRAEQGYRIIEASLNRIADTLKQPRQRYIVQSADIFTANGTPSLSGAWTGFYVEANRGVSPTVVIETITIRQNGQSIEGTLIRNNSDSSKVEKFQDSVLINNVLTGKIWAEGSTLPDGLSTFNLMATNNNNLLDGYCTWFDADFDQIEHSRFIVVRQGCSDYERYVSEAKSFADVERDNYRLRKLTEQGYELTEAVTMLAALKA